MQFSNSARKNRDSPPLSLFTCFGATSSKLDSTPDHSAVVTRLMFCGFAMSVFKTLSEGSLQDQQPFNACSVRLTLSGSLRGLTRRENNLNVSSYFYSTTHLMINWKQQLYTQSKLHRDNSKLILRCYLLYILFWWRLSYTQFSLYSLSSPDKSLRLHERKHRVRRNSFFSMFTSNRGWITKQPYRAQTNPGESLTAPLLLGDKVRILQSK